MDSKESTNARLATIDVLASTTFTAYLDPVPPKETIRAWLDRARVPRFKTNPLAKRGGGQVYY